MEHNREPEAGPLAARVIDRAVVYPTIRVASHPGRLLMGVYDGEGGYVDGAVLNRRSGERGAAVPPDLFPDVTDASEPEAIYLGPLYFHYGHFLLESLARIWYAARHPETLLVWAGAHDWQGVALRPWQREILDILGIANRIQILADPTRFESLHIPDIGYRYDDWCHPEHAAFLGRYEGPARGAGRRIWLSRRKVGNDARDLHVSPTERRLAYAGWTIVHPETLRVRQHLDLLAEAEIVAGEEGSAFHSVLLLRDVNGLRFHILRRDGAEHPNMITIGNIRGVDQTFFTPSREMITRAEGRMVSKVNPNPAAILDLLRVPVPPAPGLDPSATDRILDRVVARYAPQRLLVVGAPDAHLVLTASAPSRVAVSPHFDFDTRSYAATDVEFFELPFFHYADRFHDHRMVFDLIRVTGSDLPSVIDSFRATSRVAGPTTVWLLGADDMARRTALAIRLLEPGFIVRRHLVRCRSVYVAWRVRSGPANEQDVARLNSSEVQARLRLVLPLRLPQADRVERAR